MNLSKHRGRYAVTLAIIATTLCLTACGGGGGGTTATPEVVPTGTVSVLAPKCIIQQDMGTCSLPMNVTTKDVAATTAVTLKDSKGNSYAVTKNTAAVVPVSVPVGDETYIFYFGGATNPTVVATGSCVEGTTPDASNICRAPVTLKYPETVYAIWTLGRPYKVAVGGVKVEVTNKSSHPYAFGCGLGKVLPDGYKLMNCIDPADKKHYPMAINPMDNTFGDYKGVVPADVNWVYVDTSGAHYPSWAREALTSLGTYYVDGYHTSVILFVDLNGVVTTAVEGTFAADENINVLQAVPEKK